MIEIDVRSSINPTMRNMLKNTSSQNPIAQMNHKEKKS